MQDNSIPEIERNDMPVSNTSRLLFLLPGGRLARFYIEGLARAARRLGLATEEWELGEIWRRLERDPSAVHDWIRREAAARRVGAVLSYIYNPIIGPGVPLPGGGMGGIFEALGIPCLMFWTDHPHWIADRVALTAPLCLYLAQDNNHHFFKSEPAAWELRTVLRWRHCHAMPVAEDASVLKPARDMAPDHDIVALAGWLHPHPPVLNRYLEQDDPDPAVMLSDIADLVRRKLEAIWARNATQDSPPGLRSMGDAWLQMKCADIRRAAMRHLPRLMQSFPDELSWVLNRPALYFEIGRAFWDLGNWQRSFYLAWLRRYFKVGVFGTQSVNDRPTADWVAYEDQARLYARGRLALNITGGFEDEGVSHKPFQIAASGVPMLHDWQLGLPDCFEPGREVAVFSTPAEARAQAAALLADDDRRHALAAAALARLRRDHTWDNRIMEMLARAGIDPDQFRS